jgi:membrane-bound lytic murein transglycosylase F
VLDRTGKRSPAVRHFVGLTAALSVGLGMLSCERQTASALERVQHLGVLRVATLQDPTTYYIGDQGPAGLEYELSRRFAAHLGVELNLQTSPGIKVLLQKVEAGEVDLAAAGLAVTPAWAERVRFGPGYQRVASEVVYRKGTPHPEDIDDLSGRLLEVPESSSHAARLAELSAFNPTLDWSEMRDANTGEVLDLLWEQVVDYTVLHDHEAALKRRFMPELRTAFTLGTPQTLAWAFPPDGDESLVEEAGAFFAQLEDRGDLDRLIERYYGHLNQLDYVSVRRFIRRISSRLPRYRPLFELAEARTGFDWRLLAAMAYQESHWEPDATSPTGVRGLMMLTQATAEQMAVEDRLDPEQSVAGGAAYLRGIWERIPGHIGEPDRTWLALAAYNVGFGHLQDARGLAADEDRDANHWLDVKQFLPLLRDKTWYQKTRYGFARGDEPVTYVDSIRGYYDILVWLTSAKALPETQRPRRIAVEFTPASL